MKRFAPIALFLLAFSLGCELVAVADNPKVIALAGSEKQQALSILEQRQQINIQRGELQAKYQADMNRLGEQDNTLNISAMKLCFSLKKAHSLPPNANYALDEYKGQLVKQ